MANISLLRIKIDGCPLIKLSKQKHGRDFLLTYPIITQGGYLLESHFTFHTPNSRVTLKVTRLEHKDKNLLGNLKGDLDVYKGKIVDLSDPKKIIYLGTIALNLKGKNLSNFFNKAKTADKKFKKIKNILLSKDSKEIQIKWGAGKNYTGSFSEITKNHSDYMTVEAHNYMKDKYTFVFAFNYTFPKV